MLVDSPKLQLTFGTEEATKQRQLEPPQMLQEQTVTFPPSFLFDLMIWLQVSFCFNYLVSTEECFALFLFFPSHPLHFHLHAS